MNTGNTYEQDVRSRIENNDLFYTLRINGRVYAAFRSRREVEDLAISLARDDKVHTVAISTQ